MHTAKQYSAIYVYIYVYVVVAGNCIYSTDRHTATLYSIIYICIVAVSECVYIYICYTYTNAAAILTQAVLQLVSKQALAVEAPN